MTGWKGHMLNEQSQQKRSTSTHHRARESCKYTRQQYEKKIIFFFKLNKNMKINIKGQRKLSNHIFLVSDEVKYAINSNQTTRRYYKKKKLEEKMKIVLPPHTSSLLKALALGEQEWFMQLCKGKNAVPKIQVNN